MAQKNNDLFYNSKWKRIVNVMTGSNLRISRIAQAGSRSTHQHRLDSDMDVIFAVAGNPRRSAFYPQLIEVLQSNFPFDKVYPGTESHVVHVDFKSSGHFDLVLLSEPDFDSEYQNNLEYRRNNL